MEVILDDRLGRGCRFEYSVVFPLSLHHHPSLQGSLRVRSCTRVHVARVRASRVVVPRPDLRECEFLRTDGSFFEARGIGIRCQEVSSCPVRGGERGWCGVPLDTVPVVQVWRDPALWRAVAAELRAHRGAGCLPRTRCVSLRHGCWSPAALMHLASVAAPIPMGRLIRHARHGALLARRPGKATLDLQTHTTRSPADPVGLEYAGSQSDLRLRSTSSTPGNWSPTCAPRWLPRVGQDRVRL
jgi:hypothetical protein